MCGIVGIWTKQKDSKKDFLIKKSLDKLSHRGPNDQGLYHKQEPGELILGHRRLSIFDLSPLGKQPMISNCNRYIVTYNGEIYNFNEIKNELANLGHQFKTKTDTEVLLTSWTQWGEACLSKFIGMFAFVIFDLKEKKLYLVRDPFGIKPLYFYQDQNQLSFCSEIPPLLDLIEKKVNVNYQKAYDYLVHNDYDSSEQTFFQNIFQLLPGHLASFDLANPKPIIQKQYWWPSIVEQNTLSYEQATEKLRTLFLENVKIHMRSDVPIGAALSGGIDSSTLVCAMRYLEPKMDLHTFSFIAKGSSVNEEKWVDQINAHVNAISHKISIESNELTDDLKKIISVQGEPFGSSSIYAQYRVFKLVNESNITVTLDGQGADEMFAGYSGFPGHRLKSLFYNGNYLSAFQFLNNWSSHPGRSKMSALKSFGSATLPDYLLTPVKSLFGESTLPHWLNGHQIKAKNISTHMPRFIPSEISTRSLMSALRSATIQRGLPSLLRHGDRNSMAFSIESRVPFLTTSIAEFLFTLPENFLIGDDGTTKKILRSSMRGIVPDAVLDRKDKIGFETPELSWFQSIRPQVMEILKSSSNISIFNSSEIIKEAELILDKKMKFDWRIWRWINFCLWAQRYELEI